MPRFERRWNQALARVHEIEQRVAERDEKPSEPPPTLADFTALAERLETLWEHPETDPRLKKRIVRSLIHEIVVDLDAATFGFLALHVDLPVKDGTITHAK